MKVSSRTKPLQSFPKSHRLTKFEAQMVETIQMLLRIVDKAIELKPEKFQDEDGDVKSPLQRKGRV